MIDWREDVLGDEFECTDLQLGEDDEGPLVATLVRALPGRRSFWQWLLRSKRLLEDVDVLYVHGWSDYFFQKSLARFFTARGARFFALDLRKYGRSLREGQSHGYIDQLADYDQEIALALSIIRGESDDGSGSASTPEPEASEPKAPAAQPESNARSERKLLLLGHSTGGLVLSLWADRHRGEADAIILNSPWLELQLSGVARHALAGVVNLRARLTPHEQALPQLDLGFYSQAQRESCSEEEFAIINQEWRPPKAPFVRAGWLSTVIAGHDAIRDGIDVGAPVCVLLSARSLLGAHWAEEMTSADTVLEVESVARSSLKLGDEVTVHRIDGALHDVFLSRAAPRADAYERMERWLVGWRVTGHEAGR